jgi:hypothetical protein
MLDNFTKSLGGVGDVIQKYLNIIIAVVVLGVCWQGWKAYDRYQTNQNNARQEEDIKRKTELRILTDQLDEVKKQKAELAVKNDTLASEVEVWKEKALRNPPPKPVGDPPKDIGDAINQIGESGVKFTLTVPKLGDDPYKLGTIASPAGNAPTIWTWYKESQRVPGLETAYSTQLGLSTSLTTQVKGLVLERDKGNEIILQQGTVITRHVEREANLEVIVKETDKQVKREKFNGNVKAVAAVVLGFFVGKGVAK